MDTDSGAREKQHGRNHFRPTLRFWRKHGPLAQIEMAIVNIAFERYVADAWAAVAGCVEAFFLSQQEWWVSGAGTDDSSKDH